MILVCEICGDKIASFDHRTLDKPFMGEMFKPLGHGYVNPFNEGQTWENMRCPICHYRPFLTEDYVITPNGEFRLDGRALPGTENEYRPETWSDADLDREWTLKQSRLLRKRIESNNEIIADERATRGRRKAA